MIAAIRNRLAAERGFTLVEMLVATSLGMVVLLAAGNLLDASGRASAEIQDRVDAVQRGRTSMERITSLLRSQVCLNSSIPAIAEARADELWFYTDYDDDVTTFSAEAHKLSYLPGASGQNGSIRDTKWNTVVIKDTSTDSRPASEETRDATFSRTPDSTTTVIADIAKADDQDDRDGDSNKTEDLPLFDYFRFLGADPATPNDRLVPAVGASLTTAQMARVVRIIVAFDARPTRGSNSRSKLDTRTETDVFVRTADPTDPNNSPSCL